MNAPIRTSAPAEPTAFSIHHAAWQAAVATFEAHCAAHQPASEDSPLWHAYENSYGALVSAMLDTGLEAVKTTAASAAEITAKMAIIEAQEFHSHSGEVALEVIQALAADAKALAGDEA